MHNRRIALILGAVALLLLLTARHPTADIRILTHAADDLSPHRMQAAIDTGVLAVHVMVTWSAGRLVP